MSYDWNASTSEGLCYQLQSKWGEPHRVMLYSTPGGGGIITVAGMTRARLSELEMNYFISELQSQQYKLLTSDAYVNLHCDPSCFPSDEDIFVMQDWTNGSVRKVECFSDEPSIGQNLATWILEKAGLRHSYQCS